MLLSQPCSNHCFDFRRYSILQTDRSTCIQHIASTTKLNELEGGRDNKVDNVVCIAVMEVTVVVVVAGKLQSM